MLGMKMSLRLISTAKIMHHQLLIIKMTVVTCPDEITQGQTKWTKNIIQINLQHNMFK